MNKHPFVCGFLLVTLVFALNGCGRQGSYKSNPDNVDFVVNGSANLITVNMYQSPEATAADLLEHADDLAKIMPILNPAGMSGADPRGWWKRMLHIGDAQATPLLPADESAFETMTPEDASQ